MNSADSNWYVVAGISEVDSPALLVYHARVKQNIQTALAMIDDPARLRPHVKTHKSADVIHLMLLAGITKFKCATIAEAEMLGIAGAPDVLLAYQPVGPKLQRFKSLEAHYPLTVYSCLVDNETSAIEISKVFSEAALSLPVYLDLNIGMNRTGIPPAAALELYRSVSVMPGIVPVGLHAYDGHLRDPDMAARISGVEEAFVAVAELRDSLVRAGFPKPQIIAGGSPTFSIHAKNTGFESSPGTFVYWDQVYRHICSEQAFVPAAVLLTRVISLPDSTKICVDLGHKSVASESELGLRVRFINAPDLTPVSQNEEHLVLYAGDNHSFQIGDVLYGLPWHICPTVALYERLIVIEDHRVAGEWPVTARNRKINI